MSSKTRISREVMNRSGPFEKRLQWDAWGYLGTKYEGIRTPHFFFSYRTYVPTTWKCQENKSFKKWRRSSFGIFFKKNYLFHTISMNHCSRISHRVRNICIFVVFLEVWENLWISGTNKPRERILNDRVICEWKYVGAKNQEDQTVSFWDIDWEGDGRTDTHIFCSTFHSEQKCPRTMDLRATVFALRRYIKNIEHNDSTPHILYIKKSDGVMK